MRYSGIIKNDTSAGDGICVSLFVQGCSRQCKGCHNPETWDFEGGRKYTVETQQEILEALCANGIQRNLCIMGGEPLYPANLPYLESLIFSAKRQNENIKIYLWTGYKFEEAFETIEWLGVDYVIDGPYEEDLRDISLKWRGSSNQNIYEKNRKYKLWNCLTKNECRFV